MNWLPPVIRARAVRVLDHIATPGAPMPAGAPMPPDPPVNEMWFPADTWVGTSMDFEDTEAIQCSDWMLD